MFESARIKLTLWYMAIIMCVSLLFTSAFYHSSTRELQRLINRLEAEEQLEAVGITVVPQRAEQQHNLPSLAELKELKRRSLVALLVINGVIVFLRELRVIFWPAGRCAPSSR